MKKFSFFLCLSVIIIIAAILYFSEEITYYFETAGEYPTSPGIIASTPEEVSAHLPVIGPYERDRSCFGYDALQTENQRVAYDAIIIKLRAISDEPATISKDSDTIIGYRSQSITVPLMSRNSLDFVLSAVKEDFPEAFWISNSYYYREKLSNIELGFVSYLKNDEIPAAEEQFNAAVEAILKSVPPGLSEYERQLFLHDWIVDNCEYNSAAVSLSFQDMSAATAYGAIITGSTVCNGYARAFKLLLREVGIPSVLINGNTSQGAHIWNAVKIDGEWYHTDVTWNDPTRRVSTEDIPFYYYMNLTDGQIKKTHAVFPLYSEIENPEHTGEAFELENGTSSFNIFLPVCSSEDLNYYNLTGMHLSSADSDGVRELEGKILQLAEAGETILCVVMDHALDPASTKEWLVRSGVGDSVRLANRRNDYFSENSFSYYYDVTVCDNVVIVVLKEKI